MKVLISIVIGLLVVGCGKKDVVTIENPIVEEAIRWELKNPDGPITKMDLKKVKSLVLDSYKLQKIPKGMEKLTQLEKLSLKHNSLTDVKGIEELTQLTHLDLWLNDLTDDIRGLEKLTQLTVLNLSFNKLTNVKVLEKLTQLKTLDLSMNFDLTKSQIDELQKALPKCKITHNAK